MDDYFELIDLTSGNIIGDFDSRDEALVALKRAAEIHGAAAIQNLSLMRIEGERQSRIAMQDELVAMVEELDRVATAKNVRSADG